MGQDAGGGGLRKRGHFLPTWFLWEWRRERGRERDKLDICGVRAQGEHRRVFRVIYIRRPLKC